MQLPVRRLKHEIFHRHAEEHGLLIEGASACEAACRNKMNWLLLADILDIDPDDKRQDNSWQSATKAASLLKAISISESPWWEIGLPRVESETVVTDFDVFLCHNSDDKPARASDCRKTAQ